MNGDSTSSLLPWTGLCARLRILRLLKFEFFNRLDMLVPLNPKRDLRLSGQVIYTGISSMEVAVKMEHIGMNQSDETVLLGMFSTIRTCSH